MKCDVCELDNAIWWNRELLGSEAMLCMGCFILWYERGVTDPDEMRAIRRNDEINLIEQ